MTTHEHLSADDVTSTDFSVESCIPDTAFPSTRDQLLVALVRHHAKSSLLWELSRLPEGRVFTGAAEVDQVLRESRRVRTPLEPW
jgi:hypothetical protein